MGANVKIERLSDVVRKGWQLGVRCPCGHKATLDARALLRLYDQRGWDTRIAFVHEHLPCSRCGRRVARVGISGDIGNDPRPEPLRLGRMREMGMRCIWIDCYCNPKNDAVNVDHLPTDLPVPNVRFHIRCPACDRRPFRTMPNWSELPPVLER